MKLKVLPPNSPEAKRRDDLLAIMRDETRSDEERDAVAIAAAPLWHERLPVGVRAGSLEVSDEDRELATRLLAAKGIAAKPLQ